MGKVVTTVLVVAVAVAIVVFAPQIAAAIGASGIFGATVTAATLATITSSLVGLGVSLGMAAAASVLRKAPSMSQSLVDRLHTSVVPSAPRKIVFGTTAAGSDVRFAETFDRAGSKKDGYAQIIALASHRINAVKEWYLEETKTWANGAIVDTHDGGVLAVQTCLEGKPGNGFSWGSGKYWTPQSTFTGCAYLATRYKLDSKVWPSGIPSRYTTIVEGCPLYDPRRDSTNGGSGAHRIADQSTWAFREGTVEIGRNPALALLTYLLGYRIAGKLVWGMGIPAHRIDFDNFRTYANLCEERVLTQSGATVQRYTADGTFSTGDPHETVINGLSAAMGSCKLVDTSGVYQLVGGFDDTLGPKVDFDENDLVAAAGSASPYLWKPAPPTRELHNIVRGRFADPSSLYQLVDWGVVETDPLPDAIPRTLSLDLGLVTRAETCQRIAKQWLLREALTPGVFSATFGPKAFRVQVGSLITMSLPERGWNRKLFRVIEQVETHDLLFTMALREESSEVYAWDREEKPLPATIRPDGYNPRDTITPDNLTVSSSVVEGAGGQQVSEVEVTWTPAPSARIVGIQIESRPTGAIAWTEQAAIHDPVSGVFRFGSNVGGVDLAVRARFRMDTGVYSEWVGADVVSAAIEIVDGQARENATAAIDQAQQAQETANSAVSQTSVLTQQLAQLDADVAAQKETTDQLVETYGSTDSARDYATVAETAAGNSVAANDQAQIAAQAIDQAKAIVLSARDQTQQFSQDTAATKAATEVLKTATEQVRDQAQQAAQSADGSAQSVANNVAIVTARSEEAGRSAAAADASKIAAKTTVAAMLPHDFAQGFEYWGADWATGSAAMSSDWTHLDTEYGRVARVTNAGGEKDIANAGSIPIVAGRKMRITVKWRVVDSYAGVPAMQIFRIGMPGLAGGQFNNAAKNFGITVNAEGWGSNNGFATAIYEFSSDELANGNPQSARARVLVRLNSPGVYDFQSIRFEDVTGEVIAAGHAQASAESDRSAAAHEDASSQNAAATQADRILAQTASGDAKTYRDQSVAVQQTVSGQVSTVTEQAGIAARAANIAASRAGGNIVGKATFDATGRGDWGGSGTVQYDSSINAYVLQQTDRDLTEGDMIPGDWSNRNIRVSGNAAAYADFPAGAGLNFQRADGSLSYVYWQARPAHTGYGDFSFILTLPQNVVAIRPFLNSDGNWGVAGHGVNWRSIRMEDITQETRASGFADASAAHAATASAENDAAGQSAQAAEVSNLASKTNSDNAQRSAEAGAAHEAGAASYSNNAEQQAAAAEKSKLTARATAQAMMPSDFTDISMWTGDWGGGTGSYEGDSRFTAYDDSSEGRVLRVWNNPAWAPHVASVGREPLVRDKTYKITITWKLVGQQPSENPVNGTLYAVGIHANGTANGYIETGCSIAPGWAGWGSGWAVQSLTVTSNSLMDQGCQWIRPLFRLDSQGVYFYKSLEIRDVTGEVNAEGSAQASAEHAASASAANNAAGQNAAATQADRIAAETARGATEALRDQTVTIRDDTAGFAQTATDQTNLGAQYRDQSNQSANASAGSAASAQSANDQAGQHAAAARAERLMAETVVQSTLPSTFGDLRNFTWDYTNGTNTLADDSRYNAYDNPTFGRIVQVQNDPAFSPHMSTKGRLALVRDKTYRITVKWLLVGYQSGESVNASMFAIGIKPDNSQYNDVNLGVTISSGQAGWGTGQWATHTLDINANTLIDQGCAWVRPLFRLDSRGIYFVQQIEIRDITSENTTRIYAEQTAANRAAVTDLAASVSSTALLVASYSTAGGNLLSNTDFQTRDNWNYYSAISGVDFDLNLAGDGWHPIEENVLAIRQNNGTSSGYSEWTQTINIRGDTWYDVSGRVAAHRTQAIEVYIQWIDANGQTPWGAPSTGSFVPSSGGNTVGSFTRYGFKAKSPSGAVRANFIMRKFATIAGQGDSYAWFLQPQVRETFENAPSPAAYSPGRPGKMLANMSSSIATNQNAIATANSSLANLTTTVAANGASISTINSALSSTDGKANQALARAAVQLDVNGYVSGWETSNNGQSSDFTVSADRFRILKPGGGARMEFINGRMIATDGSSWMSVYGQPFGAGNRFVEWTGPYFADLNQCSEANAKKYVRVNGDVFFGGTLLAGSIRNSQQTSSLANNASASTGTFGSNGGMIVANASWTYSYTSEQTYAATTQGRNAFDADLDSFGRQYLQASGGDSWTGSKSIGLDGNGVVLNLRRNGALVASQAGGTGLLSLEGVRPMPGDSGGRITWTYSYAASLTYTDPEHNTASRTYSADITRNLGSGANVTQRVGVSTVE